jgi:two-component system, cell cycle response regulator DivK
MTLLHDFLKAHGYEILKASDGLEAINIARDQQPDLILMDIRLPKLNGLNATQAIPIIAVTAFATPGDEITALESGCAAYVAKPINIVKLLNTIRSLLSSSPPAISSPQ